MMKAFATIVLASVMVIMVRSRSVHVDDNTISQKVKGVNAGVQEASSKEGLSLAEITTMPSYLLHEDRSNASSGREENREKMIYYTQDPQGDDSNDDGAIDGTQKKSISERMAFFEYCLKNPYDFRCQPKKWPTFEVVEI